MNISTLPLILLQVAKHYARHMLRPAVQHSDTIVVPVAVHNLQSHVPGVRNIGNEDHRERHGGRTVPLGLEHVGEGESRIVVHGTLVDVRSDHQTNTVSAADSRHHIAGKYNKTCNWCAWSSCIR